MNDSVSIDLNESYVASVIVDICIDADAKACSHRASPSRQCHRQLKNCYVDGQMGMEPILPVSVPVKKIKRAARQHYIDGDVDARCERALT